MARKYTPEKIETARAMYAAGHTFKKIGEQLGCDRSNVARWVRGEIAYDMDDIPELDEFVRIEKAKCRKKSWGLVDSLLDEVQRTIDSGKYPARYPPIVHLAMLMKQLSNMDKADTVIGTQNQTQVNIYAEIEKIMPVIDKVIDGANEQNAITGDICEDDITEPVYSSQPDTETG